MKVIGNILRKYRWDIICGWSVMLAGCFICLFGVGTLLAAGCTRIRAKQPEVSAKQATQIAHKPFTLPEIPATIIPERGPNISYRTIGITSLLPILPGWQTQIR